MTEEEQSPKQEQEKSSSGFTSFWNELKRRKVVRVAITYAIVGWLIIQVANATFGEFGIPLWAYRFVVLMVVLGFPLAIILAWAFELTPEGIKTTKSAQAEQGDVQLSEGQQKKRNWTAYVVGAALPTLIFGLLAVYFYVTRSGESGEIDAGEKSIAILPLENMSSNPENAYFADAMHDEIITNLANISDLVVIGRTSVRQYKDTVKTLEQIGGELGVRYLVEGSVFRNQNQASINIQLIDTETRDHIWAQVYERNLDEIMSIRAAVAIDVAEQLHAILSPEEIARVEAFPTQNREAYDYYLRAREASTTESIPLMLKATELDPDFADAWRLIAAMSSFGFSLWDKNSPELLAHAQNAIKQMKRLEPEAHPTLNTLSIYEVHINKDLEAALRYRLKSVEMGVGNGTDVGWSYLQLGQLEKALDVMEDLVEMHLERPSLHAFSNRLYATYTFLGLWDSGRLLLERFLDRAEELKKQRADDSLDWNIGYRQWLLAQHNYLQEGDLSKLVSDIGELPFNQDNFWYDLWSNLILRNYKASLGKLDELSSGLPVPNSSVRRGQGLRLLVGGQLDNGLNIEPYDLLSALIHFQQGERVNWLKEAATAKTYWEKNIAAYHKVDPDYYAQLAICYALEGDRESLEATIPKMRELTENVNWQFRRQAECEVKLAIAYLVLGENETALDLLEKANELHSPMFINRELELWFIFDRLKGNPRFDALLAD